LALAVTTAALVGTIHMAAPASAKPPGDLPDLNPGQKLRGLQYVSATSDLNSNSTKTVIAFCPAGTVVVGTGVTLQYGFGQVLVNHVVPTETFVIAGAYEDETGLTTAWSVTALATCANRPSNYQIAQTDSGPSGANPKTQSVYCPGETKPLGLGFQVYDGNGQVTVTGAQAILGTSDRVMVSATEDDTGLSVDWKVKAYAICAENVTGLEVRSETDPFAQTYEIDHAWCSTGKVAIGVGYSFYLNSNVLMTHAYTSGNSSSVIASEDEDGPSMVWVFTVDAICVSS